jgi:hypothetical protein
MSAAKSKADGIEHFTPAADYTGKEGYGVTIAGNVATLGASATVRHKGIILVGGTVAQGVTVAILGSINGAIPVKISGAVTRGDELQQAADGTYVTDAGSGARVLGGVANQTGIANDLVDTFVHLSLPQT